MRDTESVVKHNADIDPNLPPDRSGNGLMQVLGYSIMVRIIIGSVLSILVFLVFSVVSSLLYGTIPPSLFGTIFVPSLIIEVSWGIYIVLAFVSFSRSQGLRINDLDKDERCTMALMTSIDGTLGVCFGSLAALRSIMVTNQLDFAAATPFYIIFLLMTASTNYSSKWIVKRFFLSEDA